MARSEKRTSPQLCRMVLKTSLVSIAFLLLFGVSCEGVSHESELRKALLTDYDKTALPNVKTDLQIGFTILGLDLDEKFERINLDTWVKLQWVDPRLTWNEQKYSDIERLAFPVTSLWAPDFTLYNNAKMRVFNPIANTRESDPLLLVWPNGTVLTVPTAVLPAVCVYDLTYWPHDIQNCTVKMGSWVFSGFALNLTPFHGKEPISFDIGKIKGSGETERGYTGSLSRGHLLVKHSEANFESLYYDCCPEPYMSVNINIVVERNAPLFNWLVKVPALVLALGTGILFLLPPGCSEKVILGSILLLTDLIYLFGLTSIVVHSPSHTPLIIQFAGEQMVFTFIALVLSCFIIRTCNSPHKDSLPRLLIKVVDLLQGPFCVGGYYSQASSSDKSQSPEREAEQQMVESHGHQQVNKNHSEWLLLGAVLDRFFLIIYFIVFFIRLAAYAAIF